MIRPPNPTDTMIHRHISDRSSNPFAAPQTDSMPVLSPSQQRMWALQKRLIRQSVFLGGVFEGLYFSGVLESKTLFMHTSMALQVIEAFYGAKILAFAWSSSTDLTSQEKKILVRCGIVAGGIAAGHSLVRILWFHGDVSLTVTAGMALAILGYFLIHKLRSSQTIRYYLQKDGVPLAVPK